MSKYINDTKDEHCSELLAYPGVVGVAVGSKNVNGTETNLVSIKVYVTEKLSKTHVVSKYGADGLIPKTINGVRTDVVHSGVIVPHGVNVGRVRPLQAGYSIGHPLITAGTLGGFYIDNDNDVVALTNNHVGAAVNDAEICDLCIQPGRIDSNPRPFVGWTRPVIDLDYFGHLKNFVPITLSNNTQDSAIIKVHSDLIANSGIITSYEDGSVSNGIRDATIGMSVIKFGRTTGRTTGTVTAINGTFVIDFRTGTFLPTFEQCIVTTAMSEGGDSGSILMTNDLGMNRADVGLLFAGSTSFTIYNQISYPINTYGLTRI